MTIFRCFFCFFLGPFCLLQGQGNSDDIDTYFDRGSTYMNTQKDSSIYFFEKAYKLAYESEDWLAAIDALIYKNYTFGYHYDLSEYKKNIDRLDSVIQEKPNFLKENPSYLPYILLDKANYYFKIKNFAKSRANLSQLITSINGNKQQKHSELDREAINSAYNFMAAMYSEEKKFHLAKEYYERNIRNFEVLDNQDSDELMLPTYNLLANLYAKQNDFKSSNYYLRKTINHYIKNNQERYKNNIVTASFNLAKNYLEINRIDSAEYFLGVAKKNLLEEDPFWPNYYRMEGDVFSNRDFKKALESYQLALQLFREKPNRFETSEIVLTLQKLGRFYEDFGKHEVALSYYQKALQNLSIDFSSNDPNKNPAIENLSDKSLALDVLKKKAHLLAKLKKYNAALSTTNTSIELLDFLRTSFESNLDKQQLFEDAFPVFETGLFVAYNLFQETNDHAYLDTAFYYTEKSKSVMLLEAIYSSKAHQFSKVPDALLEKEQQLRAEVANLEKQVKNNPTYENEEQLFQTKSNYRNTLTELESEYVDYFNLKYNSDVVSINRLQKFLNQDDAIITYFYGDSHLYSIKISTTEIEFNQLVVDSILNTQIRNYREHLHEPSSFLSELTSLSHQLYVQLLEPQLNKGRYKKLFIIPDGILNYLPFESLITESNPTKYLLEKMSVSYANSVTLLLQLKSEKRDLKLLSIAPSFDNSKTQKLQSLPNSLLEARGILNYFNGELLENEQATKVNFESKINDYGLIHFATHAILDDEFPEYSYLAFTPVAGDEDFLFISDIYNLPLDASLVTLSACETGIGDLKRGEGFISLSRAFFYSGAKSIVNTLWKINDNSAAEIMVAFYKNLSKGKKKDEALRQAQLTFLEKHREDKLSHPYYWSAFVVSGNVDPVVEDNKIWVCLLFGGLLLVSVVAIAYIRRKQA